MFDSGSASDYNNAMNLLANIVGIALLAVGAAVLIAAIVAAARRHTKTALVLLFGLAAMVVAVLVVHGIYLLIYDEADRATSGVKLSQRTVSLGVAIVIGMITIAKANNYGPDPVVPAPPATPTPSS